MYQMIECQIIVQAMHLHDPHGIEPPFPELPIEHSCKSSHTTEAAASGASVGSKTSGYTDATSTALPPSAGYPSAAM